MARYDFTKIENEIERRGLTPEVLAGLLGGAIHGSTIRRALKRGTAQIATARALGAYFGFPYESLLAKRKRSAA